MVIRVAKKSQFWEVISVLERGSLGWFLGWLKRGSFSSYQCGSKLTVLGGY